MNMQDLRLFSLPVRAPGYRRVEFGWLVVSIYYYWVFCFFFSSILLGWHFFQTFLVLCVDEQFPGKKRH